jgi:hypothetical protein
MCGIAGTLDLVEGLLDPEELVVAMTDALRHRGPDDAGVLVDAPVVLGHRRLSIIDLSSAGHQPMASSDETAWITFNGEIYNYVELREELRDHGCVFHTASDTEVLAAYGVWGACSISSPTASPTIPTRRCSTASCSFARARTSSFGPSSPFRRPRRGTGRGPSSLASGRPPVAYVDSSSRR